MGYPMTYTRLVGRSALSGGYQLDAGVEPRGDAAANRMIAGDLRRLEADQRDTLHLTGYARRAGITTEQARRVLDDFFSGVPWSEGLPFIEAAQAWRENAAKVGGGLDPALMHGVGPGGKAG
jgi:hypothetical protein